MENAVLQTRSSRSSRKPDGAVLSIRGAIHGRGGAFCSMRRRPRIVFRGRWRSDGVTRTGNDAGFALEFDALFHRLPFFFLRFRSFDLVGALGFGHLKR